MVETRGMNRKRSNLSLDYLRSLYGLKASRLMLRACSARLTLRLSLSKRSIRSGGGKRESVLESREIGTY